MATVGSIIEGAFGLIRKRPGAVAVWGLTYILGSAAIMGLMLLVSRADMASGGFVPGQPPQLGGGAVGGILFFYLGYILLSIVLINAVYRAILRPEDSGFASMRVGGDEFRMLGLAILFGIGMIVLYFVSWLGVMLLGFLGAMVFGNSGATVIYMAVLGIAFACFWVWMWVRLSLIFPMTFHRRAFAIDEGWSLGRGRFWTIFGAYLIVWVILIAVAMLLFWSTFAALFAMIGSAGDAGARQIAMERFAAQNAGAGIASIVVALLVSSVFGLMAFVLGYGVVGSAARELLIEQGDVTEVDADRMGEIFE